MPQDYIWNKKHDKQGIKMKMYTWNKKHDKQGIKMKIYINVIMYGHQ